MAVTMQPIALLYSPFPDRAAAEAAAQQLLAERLIACANLIPGAQSHYVWEGAPATAEETLLIAKTTPGAAAHAAARLEALHPYGCPAILQLVAQANDAYASWVAAAIAYPLPPAEEAASAKN